MFTALAYLPETATLYLCFRSGAIYAYFDVSEAQYHEFLGAESRGRYFLTHIRGRFRYQRLAQSHAV